MPTASSPQPYLSVVAASRNDDHGGDPLRRTQIFINCLARQAAQHRLPVEIILVDWNPVPDRPGLAAVLHLPAGSTYCTARVITVPAGLHARVKYGEKLPFFQMIAKNVGIRRARGEFILATNIDIVFSAELFAWLARRRLDPQKMYRVDRHDIQAGLSEHLTLEETLAYAWDHPIRSHRRLGPRALLDALYRTAGHIRSCEPDLDTMRRIGGFSLNKVDDAWQVTVERNASIEHLHTNGCGDFTLLSRDAWNAVRGYPEFEAFSFNIDSMGIVAAHYAGYEEVSLLPPCVCFHIEHSLGSGWTPEGEKKLFNRLRQSNILNPEWPVLLPLVDQMRRERRALDFNHAGWGYADLSLPEAPLGQAGGTTAVAADVFAAHPGTAINPAYDLDRLTLVHERRLAASGSTGDDGDVREVVQLFLPHADGGYSEESSLVFMGSLRTMRTVVFKLEKLNHQHPLRLDPVARAGVVEIAAITLLDVGSGRILRRSTGVDVATLSLGGTAKLFQPEQALPGSSHAAQPIYLLSTGDDPQMILPPLSTPPAGPLLFMVELRFLAS